MGAYDKKPRTGIHKAFEKVSKVVGHARSSESDCDARVVTTIGMVARV
jgi:hypothetical protein